MGFFEHIKNTYGEDVVEILKLWSKTSNKLATIINQKIFLLNCRKQNVYPNHIQRNFNCTYPHLVNDTIQEQNQ